MSLHDFASVLLQLLQRQDLSLILSSERTTAELELDEDDEELSGINVSAFGNEQEWQLHNHVETRHRLVTHTYDSDESTHPVLSTSCRASRRPGFFVWNIFLVMVSAPRPHAYQLM
jgi:hypothetical protein